MNTYKRLCEIAEEQNKRPEAQLIAEACKTTELFTDDELEDWVVVNHIDKDADEKLAKMIF